VGRGGVGRGGVGRGGVGRGDVGREERNGMGIGMREREEIPTE
jgi:hypothetical protein